MFSCSTATSRTPASSSAGFTVYSLFASARQSWQPGRRTAMMTAGRSAHSVLAGTAGLPSAAGSGSSGASAMELSGGTSTGAMAANEARSGAEKSGERCCTWVRTSMQCARSAA